MFTSLIYQYEYLKIHFKLTVSTWDLFIPTINIIL